jgi:hypothetical protein
LLTPCQFTSGASRCPCVRSRFSALQEAVGCNTESGERDRITPPRHWLEPKRAIGKTPQRRNGRAGRADRRPSVTVDPGVIECPENCRNGIAWLQDKRPASPQAGCRLHDHETTTKPGANGKQSGPPPPFGGTPYVIPLQQLPFLTCVVGSMAGHHICLLAPVVAPLCLSSACCLAARGLEKTAWIW